jgi:maleylacetoacetate isomerase
MMELYNYYRSSASFRVRIALHLKGIEYKDIPVHLVNNGGEQHTAEYAKLNPHQLVPVLKDGDKVITQSLAIIEYLNEIYPSPALLPDDSYSKAKVRAFSLAIAADLHPLNNLRVLQYLTKNLNLSEDQKNQWYQHWTYKELSALETELATNHHDYCFGNTPGLADIMLVPQMYNARRFSCDVSQYPTLVRIDEHCQKHEAFKKAWPNDTST